MSTPWTHTGGTEVWLHSILISAIHGDFPPGKNPGTNWIGNGCAPQPGWTLTRKKLLSLRGFESGTVQSAGQSLCKPCRGTDPRSTNRLTLQASFHFNNLYALIIHGQFRQEQPFLVRYFEFLKGSSSHFTSYIRILVLQPYWKMGPQYWVLCSVTFVPPTAAAQQNEFRSSEACDNVSKALTL